MARTIRIENEYAAPPQDVWAIAKDFANLAPLSAGSVEYRGLKSGPVALGDVIDFEVKVMGRGDWKPYRVELVELDDAQFRYVTMEQGSGVKSWRHSLEIQPTASGSKQIDTIEIDAGWLTLPTAILAKRMYRQRHAPRLALLGLST
ncbi:SRPBCC family protein [Pontivivens insulae]|uniref:Coenzyme Q-binding protein COQ10 START domain-containing protein n=1 Tax=Pontivivens insulae TaxID=1639689 RepID=A0A2R8AB15_9RHOB|nr:SRPBCC family protein [Pontivivens insulae]RED13324.1 ligand-binding SRPBCC domain-containing protein [Pontivivens insulae]SPF29416.1 hypothetical protein POI8812_01725 [Pontivivens insulae]